MQELAVYHSQMHQMALWGHLVQFVHACCMYGMLCTKCLELAPPGLNSLIQFFFFFFFLIKHLKPRLKVKEFGNLEAKEIGERGLTFILFNRGCIRQFGIRTIWIYLPDRATNAAIRQFYGKGGKGNYGWLLRCR